MYNDATVFGASAALSPATRGQWHHLVGVFSDGKVTIYMDGVKGSEQTIGGVLRNAGPTPDRIMIGATRNGTDSSFNFKGLIDEVAIYDTGLSAAQVRAHFRAAQPAEAPTVSIQRAVMVSWPSFPAGYNLEAAAKVEGPYQAVTNTPMVDGNKLWLTFPTEPDKSFFRLTKP